MEKFSFLAFQIDKMMITSILKVCESGYKRHKFPIQSLNDFLISQILRPKVEPNQINCANSQLKKRWSIVFISLS